MFKQYFFLGIFSALSSLVLAFIYSKIYFSVIADFSEGFSLLFYTTFYLSIGMIACFIMVGFRKLLSNKIISEAVFNSTFSIASLFLVFYLLQMNDPEFSKEEAIIMEDYYKGFLIPMLFFPALTWFSLKPLFIKL